MSEQLFFNMVVIFVTYILPFIPIVLINIRIKKSNSNKGKVNYQPKEQNKSEGCYKTILFLISIVYGIVFFIYHELLKLEEFKNSDDLSNAIILLLAAWFFFLISFYSLVVDKKFDSIKDWIVILAAISIAIIMSALSETEDFILKIFYNLAYVSVPAFIVYLIQKQDSESSNEKINEILNRVSNIEREVSRINEKNKEQNHHNYKLKRLWEKLKEFLSSFR